MQQRSRLYAFTSESSKAELEVEPNATTGAVVKTKTDADISQCLCLPDSLTIFGSVTTDCAATPAAASLIQAVQKLAASCGAGSATAIPAACTTPLSKRRLCLQLLPKAPLACVRSTDALTQVTTTCAAVSSLSSVNSCLTTLVKDCAAAGGSTNPGTAANIPAACNQALQNMLTTASNCGVNINMTTGATSITPGTTDAQLTGCLCTKSHMNVFNTVTSMLELL
ncbi:hypothetical protein BC830DRAFT_1174901, partial [Chytriomyces sp. MP71]